MTDIRELIRLERTRAALRHAARRAGNFLRDRRGVAAVEFALIAPLMLSMYLVTLEVGQAIQTNKKNTRAASMVADLITQQSTVTKADIDAIMQIGEATLQPYNRTKPTLEATLIEITDESTPKVRVVWSRKLINGTGVAGAAKGSTTTVPDKLKIRGTFLVQAKSALEYRPVITYTASQKQTLGLGGAFDGISMGESYYLRPRMSATVTCTDC